MKSTVFSQNNCQACETAIALLTTSGYEVEVRKLGVNCTKQDLLDAVPTARSVPQIIIGNEVFSGLLPLAKFLQDNK